MKKFHLLLFTQILVTGLFAQIEFTKITEGDLVNTLSDSRSCNFADVNADGWEDILITNGLGSGQNNLLYLNNEDGTFTAVSNDPIVSDNSPSDGATFADVDNDGDLDCFVTTWHGKINYLYLNEGNGNFIHDTAAVMANTHTYSETASWGDFNKDGWVDLYVSNSGGTTKRNLFYQNSGEGIFELINTGFPAIESHTSRAVHWIDIDRDGELDLFVSNENNEKNDLYRNDGDGSFIKITTGDIVQSQRSSTGSSWGDVNNDGYLDLFVANAGYFQEQNNQLFINNGDGTFTEETTEDLADDGGCSYGSAFADIDNDGDLDLVVANGYCNSNLKDFLYLNDGAGHFSQNTTILFDFPVACSFGCAFGDIDNDGFLDLLIAQCQNNTNQAQQVNTLFQNDGNSNNWLKVKLEGTVSNRSAIGAVVRIKAMINGQSVWQMRQIEGQSGYAGQNSLIAHFGLGANSTIDSLIVEWPSGIQHIRTEVNTNQQLFILEEIPNSVHNKKVDTEVFCQPNPVREEVFFSVGSYPSSNQLTLNLIDSLGKTVFSGQMDNSNEMRLNVKSIGLIPGFYYYVVRDNQHNLAVGKLIVK